MLHRTRLKSPRNQADFMGLKPFCGDAKPIEPPVPNKGRIKLSDLPTDLRFINVIHKETRESRRMTPNQFEDAKEDGWIIDKTIHK